MNPAQIISMLWGIYLMLTSLHIKDENKHSLQFMEGLLFVILGKP